MKAEWSCTEGEAGQNRDSSRWNGLREGKNPVGKVSILSLFGSLLVFYVHCQMLGFLVMRMDGFWFDCLESMRRLNLWESDVYPERPGTADCGYYMRTGSCAYGTKCRYNHPRDRGSLVRA